MLKAIILIIVFSVPIIFLLLFILLERKKQKGFLRKSMNMKNFLVILPQKAEKEKEKTLSVEEQIKAAEQFYSSLAGIKERNFLNRILFGNPCFVFEIAVPRLGEEIHFYVSCLRSFSQLIEKQIAAFWPEAQVQETIDYNIFNPSGASAGTRASLLKSFLMPLKDYQELKTDSLSLITSVLTKLKKEGEGAAIQIVLRVSKKNIKAEAAKAVKLIKEGVKTETAIRKSKAGFFEETIGAILSPQKKEEKDKIINQQLLPEQEAAISAISKKSSQYLFDVNLRLVSSAENEPRAEEILEQVKNSFEQFNSPVFNSIKFTDIRGKKLKRFFYNFSFRLFDETKTMLLSTGEVAALFHFPQISLSTPLLKHLKSKQAPPPADLSEKGVVLGKNVFRGEEKNIHILTEDRLRHLYLIGQTGTGKSAFLQEMILQDIEAGEGVALIDPHGELAEKVIGLVPSFRSEDVIYFNPGDADYPIALNMLEYDPNYPESKTFVVNELLEIFEKLYNLKTQGFGGPMFEQYMRNALLLIMEDPDSGNTLIEIPRVLADENFRRHKLSKCRNIVVKNFWEKEAEKAGGEAALANMVPYITSKMNVFIANDLVRPIISQQKSSFNFRRIMDEKKILIVNLAKGRLGDINSYLLGMIIVGKLLISAFSRIDIPEEKRNNFFLYIDEFHNVTTKTVADILTEARKYRLAMIFGHQFIGQLDEDTRKAIFGNVGSVLSFRVGPEDAKYLVPEYEPVFNENDLINLDNYNAILRLLIKGQTSEPFNIVTFPPKKGNPETAEMIKELSRRKYGRSREIVEAELYERLKNI